VPRLVGLSHIDLTVTDCEKSATWWQDVLGFRFITRAEEPFADVVSLRHPSGVVVDVMTHRETPRERFDERRVGLDHLSLRVADRGELERWVEHLDASGVTRSGIIDADWGPTVVFRDPDNIQLELFVDPTPEEVAKRLAGNADT
jgi:catechol 2,3-dioxygenase-like lactoylglutathione lyase family enzyme